MKNTKIVNVIQDDKAPIAVDIMAAAILDMSHAMKAITNSRLKRDAIVVLIANKTGQYKKTVNDILDNLESLEKDYLK